MSSATSKQIAFIASLVQKIADNGSVENQMSDPSHFPDRRFKVVQTAIFATAKLEDCYAASDFAIANAEGCALFFDKTAEVALKVLGEKAESLLSIEASTIIDVLKEGTFNALIKANFLLNNPTWASKHGQMKNRDLLPRFKARLENSFGADVSAKLLA